MDEIKSVPMEHRIDVHIVGHFVQRSTYAAKEDSLYDGHSVC